MQFAPLCGSSTLSYWPMFLLVLIRFYRSVSVNFCRRRSDPSPTLTFLNRASKLTCSTLRTTIETLLWCAAGHRLQMTRSSAVWCKWRNRYTLELKSTDHSPLTFLDRMATQNQQLLRWKLELQQYKLQLVLVPANNIYFRIFQGDHLNSGVLCYAYTW